MSKKLTNKQKLFCDEYIVNGFNATQAAIYAGYKEKHSGEQGSENLKKERIIAYINKIKPLHLIKRKEKHETRRLSKDGYIYLIQCGELPYFKIGMAKNGVDSRMGQLRTGNPFDLKVLVNKKVEEMKVAESYLHMRYEEYHFRGEWFVFSPMLLREIIEYMEGRE